MSVSRVLARRQLLTWAMGLACSGAALSQGVTDAGIVLGQTLSLQGGQNAEALSVADGMRLCFDQVNAAGGIHGRRIVTRILDDEGRADKAAANARDLVAAGVFLLFGAIDDAPSAAVMNTANALKVPFFGPLAGLPILRTPHQPMVFPVRADHSDEFLALMRWGMNTGMKTVGFLRTDSALGQMHRAEVERIAAELGLRVVADLRVRGDTSDAQIADWVKTIGSSRPDMVFNHGSAGPYRRLIVQARAVGLSTTFMAVHAGSSQIAQGLGPLAKGMVVSQVVPNPWARKLPIVREYQDAARKADPGATFSHGGLEGYVTAKALVMSLEATGRDLTRERWLRTMTNAQFDLGGISLQYRIGRHEGSRLVDLSMVDREGRFIQ